MRKWSFWTNKVGAPCPTVAMASGFLFNPQLMIRRFVISMGNPFWRRRSRDRRHRRSGHRWVCSRIPQPDKASCGAFGIACDSESKARGQDQGLGRWQSEAIYWGPSTGKNSSASKLQQLKSSPMIVVYKPYEDLWSIDIFPRKNHIVIGCYWRLLEIICHPT